MHAPQDGVKARISSGILGFAVVVVQASMAWRASDLAYYQSGCNIDDGKVPKKFRVSLSLRCGGFTPLFK